MDRNDSKHKKMDGWRLEMTNISPLLPKMPTDPTGDELTPAPGVA